MTKPMHYSDFDPCVFLGLDFNSQEKARLKPLLMGKIVQFILSKVAKENPDTILGTKTLEEVFALVDKQKVSGYLQEFKVNFQKQYGSSI